MLFFEITQDESLILIKSTLRGTFSSGLGITLTKHHHIREYGRLHQDWRDQWSLIHEHVNPAWREAASLGRGLLPRRTIPARRVVNLVLEFPGNVVIMSPNFDVYISASIGYHMRRTKSHGGSLEQGGVTPVYTLKESVDLQSLPEFAYGTIHWGQGAVTRTSDGRLSFDKNKAIRQGPNLFHNLPSEILSHVVDTLPTSHDNMSNLQRWKQVCRNWNHHLRVYMDPDNHWQRNLRMEMNEAWQSVYDRAMLIAQKDENKPHQEPRTVTVEDTAALCLTMKKFNFSRALVGAVASIISMLIHTNDHLLETMGPNARMITNPLTYGRMALQSHLAEGLLRHGLLQTPWHTNQTGPWAIGQKTLEGEHMDILPRLLPTGQQEPAQVRTEAQRRGYDILQILQALLDIGNPT